MTTTDAKSKALLFVLDWRIVREGMQHGVAAADCCKHLVKDATATGQWSGDEEATVANLLRAVETLEEFALIVRGDDGQEGVPDDFGATCDHRGLLIGYGALEAGGWGHGVHLQVGTEAPTEELA
jgi:hypothetical protein